MPDSEVIRVMRQFKADLAAGERAQMEAMATRWLGVERRLQSQIDALALEMANIARDGGTVSQGMLFTNVRYRELMLQLTDELEGYTDYVERTTTDRQRQLARLGISHAERAIREQGIRASFARLPVEAVQNMVGLSGDGAPLSALLTQAWPLSAQRLTQELVNGVALGYNPRKVARNMAQGMGAAQQRMEVIARTENLRVYREANRQSYVRSGVVTGYKRLATHDRRVCAACLMDEGTLYQVGEEMPEHPQGRCTMVPIVQGVPSPTWQQGEAWFREQSEATQREILGKGRYDAWQSGAFDLGELVTVKPNATWGPSLQVTPLGQLAGPRVAGQIAPDVGTFTYGEIKGRANKFFPEEIQQGYEGKGEPSPEEAARIRQAYSNAMDLYRNTKISILDDMPIHVNIVHDPDLHWSGYAIREHLLDDGTAVRLVRINTAGLGPMEREVFPDNAKRIARRLAEGHDFTNMPMYAIRSIDDALVHEIAHTLQPSGAGSKVAQVFHKGYQELKGNSDNFVSMYAEDNVLEAWAETLTGVLTGVPVPKNAMLDAVKLFIGGES